MPFYSKHFLVAWITLPKTVNPIIQQQIKDKSTERKIHAAFKRLIEDNFDELNVYKEDLALNALEEIIIHMASLNVETKNNAFDPRVRDVLNYLTDHYDQSVQLMNSGEWFVSRLPVWPISSKNKSANRSLKHD